MSYGALKNFRSTLYRLDKRLWPCKSIDQCARFCMEYRVNNMELEEIKTYIKLKLPNRDVEELLHTSFSAFGNRSAYEWIEECEDEYVFNDIMGMFRRMLG